MSATGDTLGQKLHEAAIYNISMSNDESQRSLLSWQRIANALVDFFSDMGANNPIVFKCGDSEFSVTKSGISAKAGSSEIKITQTGITEKAAAIELN
jgi:hypothetical protein